ncbi:hypothetical protein [Tumebacillus lipolyticus]|uniref:Uncharacterized protein n=1 Tax=Tumebacillus lipolyticus TaxID=1280370 RepID=A0ABW4ZYI4_9BACL
MLIRAPFTERELAVAQLVRRDYEMGTKVMMPLTTIEALNDECFRNYQTVHADQLILKVASFGTQEQYFDPGGFQPAADFAVEAVEKWLQRYQMRLDSPVVLHPVRNMVLPPATFYQELLPALNALDLPLSLDLGMVVADLRNWGEAHREAILTAIREISPSIGLFWVSGVYDAGPAELPCACQPVVDEVWELLTTLDKPQQGVVVMTDRLASDAQFEQDLQILTKYLDEE